MLAIMLFIVCCKFDHRLIS